MFQPQLMSNPPINPPNNNLNLAVIGPQRQAANLTPNPEHSNNLVNPGNNSVDELLRENNGGQLGPLTGNPDNNYLGTQRRLAQTYSRTITTPVATSNNTVASTPSNIVPISTPLSSTTAPVKPPFLQNTGVGNPPHNPILNFLLTLVDLLITTEGLMNSQMEDIGYSLIKGIILMEMDLLTQADPEMDLLSQEMD